MSNKYKICHITTVHAPFDTRIFHKQAKSLAKAGYDVTLIAQSDKNETVEGVKIICSAKPRNRLQRMTKISFLILPLALREKADVYHFHDPELIPMALILKFLGAKVIYDVHEDYPESIRRREWLPFFVRNIAGNLFNIFEKMCCRFFVAVIPATEDISKRFRNGKIIVIHNYPILQYAVNVLSYKTLSENNTIIYVGGLDKDRGIIEIIQSLGYIDKKLRVRLILLGKFTEPEFEKEVKSLDEFSKVDFVGFVPHKGVYFYLSKANIGLVLLHPISRYITSMPVKMFEYMLVGLPVIASNFPLWKEIVEGNNCGLTVAPMDPRAIAQAIEYLLERPELMEEMGRNGRKAILEKYNWEQESKKLLNLYACLLDQ